MNASLLEPKPTFASLLLRVGLAAIFAVHGYFKLYVDAEMFPQRMSLSEQRALGAAELVCGLLLLVGLFSRVAAIGIVALQVGAILLVSGQHQLMMKVDMRGVDLRHVGPEYNLVLITMALSVLVLGSGRLSLDHLIAMRWKRPAAVVPPTPAPPVTA